ncbi:MAG: hypothetical protein J7513_04535 [Solirubrobacteraceae bacterium]|nr:hypothetical protein [Solirubrobacteraceae bacterium]
MTCRLSHWRDDRGQATVELVALVPLVAGIALLIGGMLAAQRVREAADGAAVAAAIAELQGGDAKAAADAAAPGWSRVRVEVRRGAVQVRVRWQGPRALADLVDADRAVAFSPDGRP